MGTIPSQKFRGRGFRMLYSCSSGDPVIFLSATAGLGSTFWPTWATEKKQHHKLLKPRWMLNQAAECSYSKAVSSHPHLGWDLWIPGCGSSQHCWVPGPTPGLCPTAQHGGDLWAFPAQVNSWIVSCAAMAPNTLTFPTDLILSCLHHRDGEAVYKKWECFPL